MKLDPVKVALIIREKEKRQLTTRVIAERVGVSPVWVKKMWRRYGVEGNRRCLCSGARKATRPRDIGTGTRDCNPGKKGG